MVGLKWNSCLVFVLVFIISVESVDPNTRRSMSSRNSVVSRNRAMSDRCRSQNAVISNMGATFPGYAQGFMVNHYPSNVMSSHFRRSPRSRRSLRSQFRHYNPFHLQKQYQRAHRRMSRFHNFGRHGHPFAHNFLSRAAGLFSLGKFLH